MSLSIKQANATAVQKLLQADPVLTDVQPAHKLIPGLNKHTLLHAGPPIEWAHMCGPMKGAVYAALQYEGLAGTAEEAQQLADSGEITFIPCHEKQAVGPMTGITSYSMPLYLVANRDAGNTAYSTINEGAGDVLRFGAFSDNTVRRLHWIEDILAPDLRRALKTLGGIQLAPLMAQALTMSDELHMRNIASTKLLLHAIVPALVEVEPDRDTLKDIINFLSVNNDQFFLNLAMAANKAAADAAHGFEGSTLVTAIARNGVEVGIRVSGLADQWFTAPAPTVDGLYFPGFSASNACPDLGDSAIMEVLGFGGLAVAASPAITTFLGIDTVAQAFDMTRLMYEITTAEHPIYRIPDLDFRGLPTGIDIMKVIETGIQPLIHTAIAGNEPGMGMIGAGVAKAPLELFEKALIAFDAQYSEKM